MSLEYDRRLIGRAKDLRKNATPWENKLWYQFLRTYPVRFQRQKTIGTYIADFYCAKARLVVELDGGGHYTPEQLAYDAHRTQALSDLGLKTLRFTNTDVDKNFYEVCSAIDRAVSSVLPPSDEGGGPKGRRE